METRPKIIYLAGKMTGLDDLGRAQFFEKACELEKLGHIVLNPGALPIGLPGFSYMPICTAMIDAADCIYMMFGWYESEGAQLELAYAKYQGKDVIFEVEHVEDELFLGKSLDNYILYGKDGKDVL